ncbi:MAG TPA: RnfABCDGE type electron transport complex subunit B [Gammaproteobacteria bacterium]|nr:RnfABCDGE type electron transport complex subunit B [Gammaproteobacteria bacterium]
MVRKNIPTLIAQVEATLPQTQCERCGYKGCEPYAHAIVRNGEKTNLCHPGGQKTATAIATLMHQPAQNVDKEPESKLWALIVEADCIGCTKCIQVCPTDAILGGPKLLHTVLKSECTGCELCLKVCPVDCIEMQPDAREENPSILCAQASYAKERYHARKDRLDQAIPKKLIAMTTTSSHHKKETIQAAIKRVQEKRLLAQKNDTYEC